MHFCEDKNCPFHFIDSQNIVDCTYIGKGFVLIKPLKPTVDGHLLLIPKEHHDSLEKFDDSDLRTMMVVAKRFISKQGFSNYDLIIQKGLYGGQSVPHLHIHIVPRYPNDKGFNIEWNKNN